MKTLKFNMLPFRMRMIVVICSCIGFFFAWKYGTQKLNDSIDAYDENKSINRSLFHSPEMTRVGGQIDTKCDDMQWNGNANDSCMVLTHRNRHIDEGFIASLRKIDGIVAVTNADYVLTLVRAPNYAWSEILRNDSMAPY